MHHPRLVIAGTHSGVGKTTVTLAILAALRARGRQVQAFKVGPDFLDPGHHAVITGRPSRNLDGWMLGSTASLAVFCGAAADADLSIIEGMMGLFDGSSPTTEVGSTAEAAKNLQAPVLLVIDGSAMARSAAALAMGYSRFDPDVRVSGVLFNRVSGDGHYQLLKAAVESATDLAAVGYLRPDAGFTIGDRHLGLITALEQKSGNLYTRLGAAAAETVDLDRIEALARVVPELSIEPVDRTPWKPNAEQAVRVGVAYDPAFCFYYPENLELLEAAGAELVRFSPVSERTIPDCRMLYFGGGYPELYADKLAANATMKISIREFAARGGTIYAECGGMMYLSDAIVDLSGHRHDMVGLFPAETEMQKSKLTIGYREMEITHPCALGERGLRVRGHEFHYSTLKKHSDVTYAGRLCDAQGQDRGPDGLMTGNVIALYTHLHFGSQPAIALSLLAHARRACVWRGSHEELRR